MKKIRVNYIDNVKFQEEMVKYHKARQAAIAADKQQPIASDFIGKAIWDIARQYSTKSKFFGYSNLWKEEMIQDAIEFCVRYGINAYDCENYSNPLAYFTQVVHFQFIRRIQLEKKEQYIRLKSRLDNQHLISLSHNHYLPADQDAANQLIKEYEEKLEKKKLNKPAPPAGIERLIKIKKE